jgi:phenylpropionate dioxygenase-like ring-hydroxylating dioxygenase large terminal subunit
MMSKPAEPQVGHALKVTNPELIPTARYFDPDFFELEKKHMWPRVWQMACRLEEIPAVGDYTVYTMLEHSVLLLHTPEGVRAFRNACRHRGVRLAHGPGRCSAEGIVCPFHGWCWNDKGENIFIFGREIFAEELITRAEVDLAPVRIEFWAGCAFINFDDNAPSLRECLGPVAERMDARHADKLKMDWWYGTVLPTNWKLGMEAFQEGYHTMQTHPQLHQGGLRSERAYGTGIDGRVYNQNLSGREAVEVMYNNFVRLSEGMGGMIHQSELAVLERLRTMEVPDEPDLAAQTYYAAACNAITADARARGADMFDIMKVLMEQPFYPVEFMFPHFFLLPTFGAMSSYRVRPLTPETCFFEIWSLVIRPDDEPFEVPTEPTILPYDSQLFPEIPKQDYSNLPIQQLGLHDIDFMRLARGKEGMGNSHNGSEGMISNCHRIIDGYIEGVDDRKLAQAQSIVNCGFESSILDLGF